MKKKTKNLYIKGINISLNKSVFIKDNFILVTRRKHKLNNFKLMYFIIYHPRTGQEDTERE